MPESTEGVSEGQTSHNVFINDINSLKQTASPFISEEELFRRLGITEDDLVGFDDVEIE